MLLNDSYLSKDGALDLTGGLVMHEEIDDHHPHPPPAVDLRHAGETGGAAGASAPFSFASLLNVETAVDVSGYGDSPGSNTGVVAAPATVLQQHTNPSTNVWTLNLGCGQAGAPLTARAVLVKRENIVGFL